MYVVKNLRNRLKKDHITKKNVIKNCRILKYYVYICKRLILSPHILPLIKSYLHEKTIVLFAGCLLHDRSDSPDDETRYPS